MRILSVFIIFSTLFIVSCSSSVKHEYNFPKDEPTGAALVSVACASNLSKETLNVTVGQKAPHQLHFVPLSIWHFSCDANESLYLHSLPPGTYKVTEWTVGAEKTSKPKPLVKPFYFSIKDHTVTYLGQLELTEHESDLFLMVTQTYRKADLKRFSKSWPGLSNTPLRTAV